MFLGVGMLRPMYTNHIPLSICPIRGPIMYYLGYMQTEHDSQNWYHTLSLALLAATCALLGTLKAFLLAHFL
jgi:ABC-type xylose transport system permease subunit